MCALASLLVVAACDRRAPPPARGLRPACAEGFHLLLVTLDTTRADHLACYGALKARTPHLDALAARGIRFTHAVTTVPLTTPAHASLLTGQYPPTHGVRNNGEAPLAAEQATLAELLRARGYATAAFVSSFVLDRRFGLDQGFDHYDDRVERTRGPGSFGGHNERRGDATTDAALAWLASRDTTRPFFAWIHYYDPHDPYLPPAPFAEEFRGREYAGEIAFVDAQIGRLVAELGRRGELARTLIAVVADHGESLHEHGESTHGRTIYDCAVRVPFLLVCPGSPESVGVVADEVVSIVDLAPTVLDALAIELPAKLDGQSLITRPADPDRAVYVETLMPLLNNGWAPLHGLRTARDKYILAPRPEYFDLVHDPFELDDRLHEQGQRAGELAERLGELLAGWPKDLDLMQRAAVTDEETQRALSALGYAGASSPDGSLGVLDPKDMLPSWELVEEAIQLQARASGADAPRLLAEALAKLQKVLERSPRDRAALEQKARVLTAQGRLDDAAKALREYLTIRPSADAYVFLAQLALARGKPDEVESLAAAAQALEPAHGGARIALGDLRLSEGRFAEAIAAFEEALRVDPVRAEGMARARLEKARREAEPATR